MYSRFGRDSGIEEPDIISPQAARLNESVRSGPRRQGHGLASSRASASGGAGPRSRRATYSDRTRRCDGFEDFGDSNKAEARRHPHIGGRHRQDAEEEADFADVRPFSRGRNDVREDPNARTKRAGYRLSGAFSGSRNPARGFERGSAEDEEGYEEDRGDLRRHNPAGGHRQNIEPPPAHHNLGGSRRHGYAE